MWKFSLLQQEWNELKLIKKPSPRYGFVAGAFEDYWYITHGRSGLQNAAVHFSAECPGLSV